MPTTSTTATLTDRYVAAAMRTVPEKQRDDLGTELRASIDDQVDARVDGGEPREGAEIAVLTELGDPDELAAGYTDRPLYLIGPRYYLEWWRLLKLLWAIVPACAVFGVALGMTIAGESVGEIVGTVWAVLVSVVVHVGFWTTLVFFIVERSAARTGVNASLSSPWTPESLPEPRPRGIGFGEMVASLVFLAVAAGAIVWDQIIGFVPGYPGLSFLDPGLWPWWITALFVVMAMEAALSVAVYLVGRWTVWLAVVNTVLAVAVAVPALVLLAAGSLIDPAYFPTIIPDSGDTVGAIITVITGFAIAGIAVWDIADVAVKTVRSRR